ncbi:5 exonuclease subunit ski4 [Scheffersomyces coipomensis]|uniref:5 exonuclease subunit ski4 n=1 Tax=Scheffersomyces coipomensis TaxID=1788519 RepID=UPI00315D5D0B
MILDQSDSGKVVIPGQYITPTYKLQTESNVIEKYISGKGTTITPIQIADQSKVVSVITASILGKVYVNEIQSTKPEEETDGKDKDDEEEEQQKVKTYLVVVIPKSSSYINFQKNHQQELKHLVDSNSISINLPTENDIVLVKVTKITLKQIYCEILTVENGDNVLKDGGIGVNGDLSHVSVTPSGGSASLSNYQTIASSQSTLTGAQFQDIGENFRGIIRSQDIRSTERDKVKVIESYKPGDIVRAMILSLGDGSNYYLTTARNDLGVIFAKSENGSGNLMYPLDWQNMIDVTNGIIEKRKCANPFT